ncbi:vWA domain-containing protein [Leucothrix pacifica]|uniref:VWFA domain-containing protein n=1 Tax=Leucothrix pacifica TaxID=1247513 RepID=A0A317CIX9_9GAMM|nr:vWA domain-containing protein [Leucothrix pacifica]PWQ98227.1 hypothetical protein DKW60_08350 [Leucothrix pacifica]
MNKQLLALSIAAILSSTSSLLTQTTLAETVIKSTTTTTISTDPLLSNTTDMSRINRIANQQPKIEVVFVLDTTGSMSGLIKAAKEKIWSIASTMAQAQTAPEIKMGLVGYRDRGDAYVTKTIDLSEDLDSMYSTLMDFQAQGGGDTPESVNQALYDAVHKMSWNQDQSTYKVVFLVGDAPAHMDYQDEVQYPETIRIAQDKGIIINAIQSGHHRQTTRNWQRIAKLGQGDYFQVGQSGNAIAIATPYDDELAQLSKDLDKTRVYYGTVQEKRKQEAKIAASSKLHRESSKQSQARRAAFNTSASGKSNFLGEKELVEEVVRGDVELSAIATEQLPEEMKAMKPSAQLGYIKQKAAKRRELQVSIKQLAAKRDAFLKQKVAESGMEKDSLDAQIFDAISEQSAKKGLVYDKKDMKY